MLDEGAFWPVADGGRGSVVDVVDVTDEAVDRRGSPARSTRVLRFWAGSGTEIRKPRSCKEKERNPQFDP